MAAGKYLLITSDDFGMCHAVNRGIVRALTEGVLTSTTLMAPCPWFFEAAHLTQQLGLKVGVHLTLTCEWDRMRWGPITRAPSLCAHDGGFHVTIPDLVALAKDEDILRECDAQIERVRTAGIEPTYVDMHMVGGDDNRPGVERIKELRRQTCEKHGLVYTRDFRAGTGLVHFDKQAEWSSQSEEEIWEILKSWTKPGFHHLITHAAEAMPELEALCSPDHHAREWAAPYRIRDLIFLTRPSTRARLGELGFELIDVPKFFELKKSR